VILIPADLAVLRTSLRWGARYQLCARVLPFVKLYFRPYHDQVSRITSKYQLALPKAIAQQVGLRPGDDVDCEAEGDVVRLRSRTRGTRQTLSVTDQLILFDMATERQRHREQSLDATPVAGRGWSREDLYEI
jgi:AbrB family looped-hinge helix DNA binding protein